MSKLKVISWNIWGGKNLEEILDCLKTEDADIVGLQEVLQDENGENNVAKMIAETLGYEYIYATTELLTPDVSHLLKEHKIENKKEWGNAILSKYKLTDSKVHILSDIKKRIALEAIVNINGKKLHIFSTHLAYSKEVSEIQKIQAENLLKIIPKENLMVMGDFNATPTSEAIQIIKKILLDTENDLTKHTFISDNNEKQKLDYIFVSKDVKIVSSGVIDSQESDHFPVYSKIEL